MEKFEKLDSNNNAFKLLINKAGPVLVCMAFKTIFQNHCLYLVVAVAVTLSVSQCQCSGDTR